MSRHRPATAAAAAAAVYRGRGYSVECSDPCCSGMPKPLSLWSCIYAREGRERKNRIRRGLCGVGV